MKILYIITQAEGGGAQKYVLQLAKHFGGTIAAGDESPELFRTADSPATSHGIFDSQLTTVRLHHLKRNISPWHDLLAIFELRKLIKKVNPDIVHLNSTKAGFLGSFAGKLAGAKVIFTAHGFRFLEPLPWPSRFFYLTLEKFSGLFRDFIIAVSEADRSAALKHSLIARDKIRTIHNGLPPVVFLATDESRAQLKIPAHIFAFVTVANFYKTKGLDVLISAVAGLDPKIRDKFLFMIIGDGPERGELEVEIKKYALENTIKLMGKIPDAGSYLKAFDAFILPSRKEGFPYAILEAMQAGLPVIATNTGGIPEALGDAGIRINPQDPKKLSEAIIRLYRDADLQKKLASLAQQRSLTFTEEKMFGETETVYKN